MNVCIATPEVEGITPKGTTGAFSSHLARLLASNNIEATLLLLGHLDAEDLSRWRSHYGQQGIFFDALDEASSAISSDVRPMHVLVSLRAHEHLKNKSFDVIHLPCRKGMGFIPLQARQSGLAYDSTLFTNVFDASTFWTFEGMKEWPADIFEYFALNYCEKYSFSRADFGISPTNHMFEWAQANFWTMPERTRLIRYPFVPPQAPPPRQRPAEPDGSHLIFLGRVETRKGFELFVDAVDLVLQDSSSLSRISVIGAPGKLNRTRLAPRHLFDRLRRRNSKLRIEWFPQFDDSDELEFIRSNSGTLIMPSLQDNCPYAVINAIMHRTPFLAARVDGIRETVGAEEVLFEPTPESLASAINRIDQIPFNEIAYSYSAQDANQSWLDLHQEMEKLSRSSRGPVSSFSNYPKVSICIPHFNSAVTLGELLISLEGLTYPNYEVICVDDASTNPEDRDGFEALKQRYESHGWRFIVNEHGGPSKSRNCAASYATGEFIVFVDSDNIVRPHMVDTMVKAIRTSGKDCLTCHTTYFHTIDDVRQEKPRGRYGAFLGPCMELGLLVNILGDTNFIIRRSVFEEVGGFPPYGWEDWALLTRLALDKYEIDVIPEPLYWYRRSPNQASRRTKHLLYDKWLNVLLPWKQRLPDHAYNVALSSIAQWMALIDTRGQLRGMQSSDSWLLIGPLRSAKRAMERYQDNQIGKTRLAKLLLKELIRFIKLSTRMAWKYLKPRPKASARGKA